MAKGKELSNSEKELIIKHWKEGKSYRKIADILTMPFTTISSVIAKYKKVKTVENKSRSGAPRKISPKSMRKIQRKIQENPMTTRREIQEELKASGIIVTKRTISNELHRSQLRSCSPKKTPLLLKKHRDARLKFVCEHKN